MDIRQLRTGNLVTTNGKPSGTTKDGIYKVLGTNSANMIDELGLEDGATLQILDGDYKTCFGTLADYIEPIEVTDKLLDKIGFQKSGDSFIYFLDKYEIYITSDFLDSYYGFYVISIYYNDEVTAVLNKRIESEKFYLHTIQNLILDITELDLNVDNLITK